MSQFKTATPADVLRPNSVVDADEMLRLANQQCDSIEAGIAGLTSEIDTPASYVGPTKAAVFNAESASFAYDVAQAGGATSLVNYILRSGTVYQLPMVVGGAGIFLAHAFRIVIWQDINVAASGVKAVAKATVGPNMNNFFAGENIFWTTKFSCWPVQPGSGGAAGKPSQAPAINYRWNLKNMSTGEQYCDNLLPGSCILNRNFLGLTTDADTEEPAIIYDGDWHEFDVPWRFDKAETITLDFLPLTDIIQFDSSINGTNPVIGLPYDDRINGVRNQAVYVQMEFAPGRRIGGGR